MAQNWTEPVLRDYSFNVAAALGQQGRPRGGVYLGVELELDIAGWEDRDYEEHPEEPQLRWYADSNGGCYHYRWVGSPCKECYAREMRNYQRDLEKYQIDLKYWNESHVMEGKNIAWPLKKMPGFVLLKEDSTVEGVEIVSAPASLRLHRNRWKSFFTNLPKEFEANDNCGMHVHLSRDPLTIDQRWAINEFINHDDNEKWMVGIAGRDFVNSDYCEKKQKSREDIRRAYDNHHDAVSICEKKPTMEVRIFASTRKYEDFMARLEFVTALVHFVQEGKWTDTSLRPPELRKFIKAHELTYPHLVTHFDTTSHGRCAGR